MGGIKYDRNFTKRLFGFGSGDFTHDELQGLNLRSIYTGGLGWHWINTPNTTLDLLGGINYTRETYSGGSTSTTPGVNVTAICRALRLERFLCTNSVPQLSSRRISIFIRT
jgi:putative salt-induced outer membrane protein YdiY